MHRSKRRKRASATQLYQTCKLAGTCPSDVINKVEHTTLADKILQWGSLGVFFGGLGIGTGSGTGGRTGYIPIGTRPPTVVDVGPPARPPVVIEPVGASDPSIVTLVEDSSIIASGSPHPTFTGTGGFEVTTASTTTPAVLDITPSGGNVQVSSSSFINPLFTEPAIVEPPQAGEVTGHVLVSTPTAGSHGYEEIPMQTFAVRGTGDEPISSTPLPGVRRVAGPRLYSRAYQQVHVQDPRFLSQPETLVTYDNPVFDTEETILFEHPSIHQVPDPDFLDIVALHRPALTARRGTVRYSRLGQRATLKTRSGKRIGATVHFYQDLSPIAPVADELEMQPLVSDTPDYLDSLYDIYADTASVSRQRTLTPTRPSTPLQAPSVTASSALSSAASNTTVPLSTGLDIPVFSGPDSALPDSHAVWPVPPAPPGVVPGSVLVNGSTYYLLPPLGLLPKKRKRFPYFFADGNVEA
ncbi:L2 protein [Alphapapillomavirus 14]|uniref:Minor capsid protein L2 n=1 Tax=Human papillomavirus type 90 TaxID=333769 RepID=A0A159DV70_9PAPI|nr:L2 [Human papillomavirus type 90]WBM83782.1 L2 protein [Alphapapillomavirus 14]CAD1813938.1 L2 [Human papillomavirus type 90]CAD1814338.1 L2 [Human papillomavirus type 90]